jgi:hypothetical protein
MAKRRHKRNSTSKKPTTVNTVFWGADDQLVISDTEDNLQKAAYELNEIITEHSLTISVQKTKLMSFKG